MIFLIKKYKIPSLIITSLIIGLVWRLEVELHGWQGLIWVKYFHFSVPIGLIIFILWANLVVELKPKKRIYLNIIGVVFGATLLYFIEICLTLTFIGGPSAMFLLTLPTWKLNLLIYSIFILVPLLPIGSAVILKLFGIKVRLINVIVSIILLVVSIPITIKLLEIIGHKGSHDIIHAIKSGIIIPFIVMAVGIIFITKKS